MVYTGDLQKKPSAEGSDSAKVQKKEWSLSGSFCDFLEASLNLLTVPRGRMFLEGAFAPVGEGSVERDLVVRGTLPACVNGEFVRTGPNPYLKPRGGYHWFDGDGMLHGVRVKDGKANYVNRYVETSRLKQERAYGAPIFVKLGDMSGWVGIGKILVSQLREMLGVVDTSQGRGTGNTALVYHSGRLLALNESDAPYMIQVFQDGEMETVGRLTYEGKLDHPFTAHPKVDPVTGEMFTFGYNPQKTPHVTYRVVSPDGSMSDPVPITVPNPIIMHDFAITENYAIFMDLPLVFRPDKIVKAGFPMFFDKSIPARYGILPRYAKSESQMKWFQLPSHYVFHVANAWEEEEEVVLIACHIPDIDLGQVAVEDREELHLSTMHEYRFNMKTGEAKMTQLADFFSDFPRINESYVGRKQRYVYCSVMKCTKIIGVAKYDVTRVPDLPGSKIPGVRGTCVGYFPHGNSRYGSEPVFVPVKEGMEGEEDDGYLLNFVHDESTGKSEMVVVDAKTMSEKPTAVVEIPRRVPYGFHGLFVSEEQLSKQKA